MLILVLFGSGAAWLVVDGLTEPSVGEGGRDLGPYLLMAHGGGAMLFLLMLGAVIPIHACVAWRSRMNRASGVVMLVCDAVLIVTAFGLYYLGSELLRQWASGLHIAFGLGFPALLAIHVILGKRRLHGAQMARCNRGMPAGCDEENSTAKRRATAVR